MMNAFEEMTRVLDEMKCSSFLDFGHWVLVIGCLGTGYWSFFFPTDRGPRERIRVGIESGQNCLMMGTDGYRITELQREMGGALEHLRLAQGIIAAWPDAA